MSRRITSAMIWQGITRCGTQEPLHETLRPNSRVIEALERQGLTYAGLSTRFLHPMGNTTVHVVPYHEGLPEIPGGLQRAECGAHEDGWYAVINIRAMSDKTLHRKFIEHLGKIADVGIAARAGEQGKVLVTMGHILAADTYVYTISLIDTELPGLSDGREKVNRVARELLVSKLKGIGSEEKSLADALAKQ
jgi:hypothetical protein